MNLTHSPSGDHALPHSLSQAKRLVIFTNFRSTHSQLISNVLSEFFDVAIRTTYTPDYFPSDDLVIIDCQDFSEDRILHNLDILHKRAPNLRCALFAADRHLTELALDWPQLVGVFERELAEVQIIKGLSRLINGGLWLPRQVCDAIILRQRANHPTVNQLQTKCFELTERESELLLKVSDGLSNQEIAEHLVVSENTVKSHLYSAFKKLGVKNRVSAINWVRSV